MSKELDSTRVAKADKLDGEIVWAWETWVDSFDDLDEYIDGEYYREHGFDSAIVYVRDRLMPITDKAMLRADFRQPIIRILTDAGFSNRAIAGAIGISEGTIRNDKKVLAGAEAMHAVEVRNDYASNEVDAAGQRVESVGHIEDDEQPTLFETEPALTATQNVEVSNEPNKDKSEEEVVDRFAGVNFDALIIPASKQIIEAEPSGDTPEYFVPRQPEPKPLEVIKPPLPPAPKKAYHDEPDEFLDEPLTLRKAQETNKDDPKHCKTCACSLLP